MSLKILVVDDEPDVVEFQKSFLLRRKHQVFTATNTNEAIEVIKKENPDLVFCDVRLDSDRAGLIILEEAKKIKPGIIVYLVTGLIEKDIQEEGLRLGAKEILIKPIPNGEVEKRILENNVV